MKAFINDSFIDIQHASLSVNDLAINRGYSVFDFLRTHHQIPLYINDHLNRFQHSADLLRLKIPYSLKKVKSIILELIKLNQLNNYGIRMVLTGGISENNFTIAKPNFIITSSKISLPSIKDFEKGMKLITHDFKRTIASSKSTNYLMAIWLQ